MKLRKIISLFSVFMLLSINFNTLVFAEQTPLEIANCEETKVKKERYKTCSSVEMLIERENNGKTEVLLQLRKNKDWMNDFWDFSATGHIEEGETVTESAIRETKEELCIDINKNNIEFVSVNHNNFGEFGVYYCFCLKVKSYNGEIKIGEPDKCAELKWFDIENLPDNIISVRKSALEDYRKGIIYNEIGWEKKDMTNTIKNIQSKHFSVFYDSACDEKLVSDMINAMENNLERIESDLKVKLNKTVEVKLYSDKKRFQNDVRLLPEFKNLQDWARGIGYFDAIYMLLQDKTPDDFIKMAVHELIHVITHKINASPLDRIPLLEGIATYMANYPPTDLEEEHSPNGIKELFSCRDVGHPDYLKKMYSCGYSFVKFIVENYGYDTFIELYKKDYSNNEFDDEIREIYEKWIAKEKENFETINKTKNYISSLGELQGEKIKLCDYDDSESNLILAKQYLEFDEETRNLYFSGMNINEPEDILLINKFWEQVGAKIFIIKNSENKPVGHAQAAFMENVGVNIGVGLAKQFWGKSYAVDVAEAIMKKLYEDKITTPICINIEPENAKSLKALEKGAKEFGVENFAIDGAQKVFNTDKYRIGQKSMNFEMAYKIDEENSDFVIISMYSSGNKMYPDGKVLKRIIKPELLEKGSFETEFLYFEITPIYEA